VLPIGRSTGEWDAALAGFLAIGIAVLGALAFGDRWLPAYPPIEMAVALILGEFCLTHPVGPPRFRNELLPISRRSSIWRGSV
jgi:hypothetical protein